MLPLLVMVCVARRKRRRRKRMEMKKLVFSFLILFFAPVIGRTVIYRVSPLSLIFRGAWTVQQRSDSIFSKSGYFLEPVTLFTLANPILPHFLCLLLQHTRFFSCSWLITLIAFPFLHTQPTFSSILDLLTPTHGSSIYHYLHHHPYWSSWCRKAG